MLRDVRELLDQECTASLQVMVTFTEVEVTDDLRYATIYYTVLGQEEQKRKVSRYFQKNRSRIQAQLGRLLSIKTIPEIKFEFDPSIERGMRIEQLLKQVTEEDDRKRKDDSQADN